MEVEAKFSIPDERTFQRLLEATSLAGYSLEEPALLDLHDRYLDTGDGAILAGGYACRIRQQDGLTLATLKGLGTASGAIHHRIEHEVELPQPLPPQQWPPSVARDLCLAPEWSRTPRLSLSSQPDPPPPPPMRRGQRGS